VRPVWRVLLLASVPLTGTDFGRGGRAEFFREEREHISSAEQDSSWDTTVELSIEGVQETHVIAINPRRLAYLPLLFSPRSWPRRRSRHASRQRASF
jgi:hypothetical protein